MPAKTISFATDDLRDTTSDLYGCYANDLLADGFAVFTYEPNALAFASTYTAQTGQALNVSRNRDSRWVVKPV